LKAQVTSLYKRQFLPVFRRYPHVAAAGLHPLTHYLERGFNEKHDPNPFFDTAFYLRDFPELRGGKRTPLEHYIEVAGSFGVSPSTRFHAAW
jgi:hypothetical protein